MDISQAERDLHEAAMQARERLQYLMDRIVDTQRDLRLMRAVANACYCDECKAKGATK